MAALADWILSTANLSGLRTLIFNFVDDCNFSLMEGILSCAGTSLRNLSIDLRSEPTVACGSLGKQHLAQKCMAYVTALESLCLRFLQGILDPSGWVEAFLTEIKSENLRCVTLGGSAWRTRIIHSELMRFSKLVVHRRFSKLEELGFEQTGLNRSPEHWRSESLRMVNQNVYFLL